MGLLKVGKPLSWEDASQHRKYVREHGVLQFLNTYNRVKGITAGELLWGDEVEYGIFKVDPESKTVKLSLRGVEVLKELQEKEKAGLHRLEGCTWHPEYGSWMVEATPRQPFSGYAADLVRVERNMRLRRKRILSVLRPGEVVPTMTCFPLMGVGTFVDLPRAPSGGEDISGPVADLASMPECVIHPHPRFGALTRSISMRRGSNADVRIPLFHDMNTPEFQGKEGDLPCPLKARSRSASPDDDPIVKGDQTTEAYNGERSEDNHSLLNVKLDNGGRNDGNMGRTDHVARKSEALDSVRAEELSNEVKCNGPANVEGPHIHMDNLAFGMGCCCLQVTFQARDVDESRFLYDQLAVLSPVMLALTAATPILRGRLVETDVRWDTIVNAVDDRTPAERGLLDADPVAKEEARDPSMVGDGVTRIYKSRYDSISTYLHYCKRRAKNPMHVLHTYNDIPCVINKETEDFLVERGVDPALAYHVAHLFARDPLVIFDGAVQEVDDLRSTEHFENIQSTNWQTVRWKPPPPRENENSPRIGWRTEFRPMEVQSTDAENAAFVVFVVLVNRVILAFDLNLYIPLSKVDENMRRAHMKDAVHEQKFWWRMHMAPPDKDRSATAEEEFVEDGVHPCDKGPPPVKTAATSAEGNGEKDGGADEDEDHKACDDDHHIRGHEEMSISEIMLGKGNYYPGLIPLVYAYLGHIGCDSDTMDTIDQYMVLICKRASGELKTTAHFIREFVQKHPAYRQDSVISEPIAYDLIMELKAIGEGEKHAPSLLGDLHIRPVKPEQAYDVPLSSAKVPSKCLDFLVKKYSSPKVSRHTSPSVKEKNGKEDLRYAPPSALGRGRKIKSWWSENRGGDGVNDWSNEGAKSRTKRESSLSY